eukprot:893089-Pyramimonas_sp.AAC.1
MRPPQKLPQRTPSKTKCRFSLFFVSFLPFSPCRLPDDPRPPKTSPRRLQDGRRDPQESPKTGPEGTQVGSTGPQ